jgi:hypothetical protein
MRTLRPAVLFLPLLLLAASCGELTGLIAFQQEFRARFELNSVEVQRSGAELAVTVGDRRFQDAGDEERAAAAREMAEYVRDRYEGYPRLEVVVIRFSHTRRLAVATMSSARVHRFPTAELGPPGRAGEAPEAP